MQGKWPHGAVRLPGPALPTFRVMGQVGLQKFPFPIGPRPASALLCAGLLQGKGDSCPRGRGRPQGQEGLSRGWVRGAPKLGEEGVDRDQGGQTYPGAHEGNLLVVEAVHGAGDAGSAPGPLSIDAGPGRGVRPGLRQVRGWGVEGTARGRGQTLAPAAPGAGWVRVRGRHASPGSRPAPAAAGRSPPARDVTEFL